MSKVFDSIKSLVPKRSRHILHNYHAYDAYIGDVVPFYQRDVVPGDNLKIYLQNLIREKPLIAPVMGEKDVFFRFFFVPYRILDDKFEEGVTGGDDGKVNYSFPSFFDDVIAGSTESTKTKFFNLCRKFTLWDYFGFPIVYSTNTTVVDEDTIPALAPSAYLWRAYYSIWNNYFRDEELQEEVNPFNSDSHTAPDWNINCLRVNYARDYFTSAALEQQKGIAPSFSVSGILPVQWQDLDTDEVIGNFGWYQTATSPTFNQDAKVDTLVDASATDKAFIVKNSTGTANGYIQASGNVGDAAQAVVNLDGAVGFDVAELRQLVQIQKILERASRTGSRYTEWLRSFFSVAPSDARLNRPEYIGGYRQSMISSEVLQTNNVESGVTSTNTNAVGAMKGHGISAASTYVGKYFVKEYGVIMGLMYARPKVAYTQGVNRQWIKKGRYDFYLPQLCNLSEQGIFNAEVYYNFDHSDGSDTSDIVDSDVWGFQGAWSEMRSGTSVISGSFRNELDYWAYSRTFASRPENNSNFITVDGTYWQRFYNEQSTPQLYCETDVTEDIVRPITMFPEPGRLDHDM